jgi:hypothetical protein
MSHQQNPLCELFSTHHADLSVRKREALRTVCERHRSFTWRVECSKDVDEHSNQTKMSWAAFGNQETQSGGKQRPGHLWEGEQKQASATECVDGPDGRPCEDKVDKTKAEGSDQGFSLRGTGLAEDGAGVECDDVDYE